MTCVLKRGNNWVRIVDKVIRSTSNYWWCGNKHHYTCRLKWLQDILRSLHGWLHQRRRFGDLERHSSNKNEIEGAWNRCMFNPDGMSIIILKRCVNTETHNRRCCNWLSGSRRHFRSPLDLCGESISAHMPFRCNPKQNDRCQQIEAHHPRPQRETHHVCIPMPPNNRQQDAQRAQGI